MQESLFSVTDQPSKEPLVAAARPTRDIIELAEALPATLRMGTSSWNYPGWAGLVWGCEYRAALLSRNGLPAYASHPLLRTVSVDRGFYRPLSAVQFAEYAEQVPAHFRFMVKAPGQVTDALLRDQTGRGKRINAHFLDIETTLREFIEPMVEGLGSRLGALVFQISPLPGELLARMPEWVGRLRQLLRAIPDLKSEAPDSVVAVEVRNQQWLRRGFTEALGESGATYCLGLHAKMPSIADQLPILRALWPGPLVCRWSLNRRHGAFGYEQAKGQYQPFDRLVDPDRETRMALAKVIAGTVEAGQNAWISLGNKAEGCAPLSVVELAGSVRELLGRPR